MSREDTHTHTHTYTANAIASQTTSDGAVEKCRLESIPAAIDGAQRSPKLRTTPRARARATGGNFISPLVFADSFRQIGLAVYLGFCSRIHEREQSVRDGERECVSSDGVKGL